MADFGDDPEIHGVVEQSADDISPAPVQQGEWSRYRQSRVERLLSAQ